VNTLHFEDFEAGETFELGTHTFTAEEIVAFAHQYDPQPFHVDEAAAEDSAFGGLIASGWHTSAIWMRLYVDALLGRAASMGSPGLDELRWLKPVRPGDTLSASLTVLDTSPSKHRPDRGTIHFRGELRDDGGEVVLRMTGRGYFARRGR